MDNRDTAQRVKLNWGFLLGFDRSTAQARSEDAGKLNDPRLAKLSKKYAARGGKYTADRGRA